jgi:hypothetical protein
MQDKLPACLPPVRCPWISGSAARNTFPHFHVSTLSLRESVLNAPQPLHSEKANAQREAFML